jgi:hypothetical protein
MTFDISIIDTIEALEQFVPEWLAFLESGPFGATAFNDPRYVLANWKTQNKETQQSIVVVLRESEEICCIAPLGCQRRAFPIEIGFKKICSIKIQQLGCNGDSFIFHDMGVGNKQMFDHVFQVIRQQFPQFDIL